MENNEIIKLNAKDVYETVRDCIERREIIVKDGTFYGMLENGNMLLIEKEWLKTYIKAITEFLTENNINNIDLISVLYAIDQDIFLKGWNGVDANFSKTCARIIKSCKIALQQQSKSIPDDVVEMIEYSQQFQKQVESIDKYILQLLEEDVITEEVIKKSKMLDNLNRNQLESLCIEGKVSIKLLAKMNSLATMNLTQIKQLIKIGFFKEIKIEELKKLEENGFFNEKGIIELQKRDIITKKDAIDLLGGKEKVAKKYRRLLENKNRREANSYFELMSSQDVLTLYIHRKLKREDLDKVRISRENIDALPEQDLLQLAKKGFPNNIQFTEEELLSGYLTKYSGKTLIELAKIGYIHPKSLLKLNEIEPSEEKERAIQSKDLFSLYTPTIITELLMKEEIDTEFINKLNVQVLSTLDKNDIEEYIKQLVVNCKNKMDDTQYAQVMINLIEHSNLPRNAFSKINISQDKLMDMFLNGEISENNAIQYFNEGIFGLEELKTIYGYNYDAIINLVKQGALIEQAISIIPNNVLGESLILEELTLDEVFRIYSKYEEISIQDLREIFDEYGNNTDQRISVVDYIEDNFDTAKIRELFENNILTHSDVLELEEQGKLTEKQSEEIAQINRDRLYKEIFGKGITSETDGKGNETDQINIGTRNLQNSSKKEPAMSAKKREEFFTKLGKCDFRDVESKDTQGREAPFGGYELIGFPDYGVVIFENFDKANNATYIMTLQELKSYVTQESNDTIVFRKSKKALRNDINKGRAVKLCNHTPNWGHNVIEAIKTLSKEAKQEITTKKQSNLADMMRQEFIRSRLEQSGGTDNPLIEMLVEKRANVAAKQVEQDKAKALEAEVAKVYQEKEEELKKQNVHDF